MTRVSFWSVSLTFLLFSVKVNRSEEVTKNESQAIDSARFVPPPPPIAPSLLFPVNSATGILVAIAIPVPLPDQSVFVSYNFEINYNMPNAPSDSINGPLNRLKLNEAYPAVNPSAGGSVDDSIARNINEELADDEETTELSETSRRARSVNENKLVFTRRGTYRLLESRLNANLIKGKTCLLQAICETARYSFLESNGVIGHVIHVLLTPSSSMNENLPPEYLRAEINGKSGNCWKYEKNCNFNILNVISKIV